MLSIFYNVVKVPRIVSMINEIGFKCTAKKCSVQIKYGDVEEHDLNCPELPVTCIGCSVEILRGELENHEIWFNRSSHVSTASSLSQFYILSGLVVFSYFICH